MDAFVRRLVERLFDPARPLTRNRHFHTFDNPDGRRALRIHQRLASLRRDIEACRRRGGAVQLKVLEPDDEDDEQHVELRVDCLNGLRVTTLDLGELQLLSSLPGMGEALRAPMSSGAVEADEA